MSNFSDTRNQLIQNKQTALRMWSHVYSREWDALRDILAPECKHKDMPSPDAGAIGPDDIVARLRIGFDLIERFEHTVSRVVAEEETVIVEHRERWHFETGEVVENHLVSVHEVSADKISLWRDYWDINGMLSSAPQWWIEAVANESPLDFS
jgi:limonene-1,2-epoxide hydrolase